MLWSHPVIAEPLVYSLCYVVSSDMIVIIDMVVGFISGLSSTSMTTISGTTEEVLTGTVHYVDI